MSKRLILVLAFAFVVGVAFCAYAEVQNVKVSGDITMGGVYRNNFDLAKTPTHDDAIAGYGTLETRYQDRENDLFSITRIRLDADLTDNVSVVVRLLNERNWNGESVQGLAENNRNIGLGATAANPNAIAANGAATENQIDLDLAYVTLKEFLYSPLTISAGRQEIHLGNDFIMGDPDTNIWSGKTSLAEGDLSARKSFDAVRATLDYNPLMIDVLYAKLSENNTVLNDDITLSGLNAKYDFDKNTSAELYFFSKIRGSNDTAVLNLDTNNATTFGGLNSVNNKADKVYTLGTRVVNKTVKNLTIDAQGAYQFGIYNPKFDPNARWLATTDDQMAGTGRRRAWATEIIGTYDLKDINMISKYNPSISGYYIYLSGASRDRLAHKAYTGWDPMFENQTFGHIINAMIGFTNTTLAGLSFKAKPIDDVTAKFDYISIWFNKRYPNDRLVILSGIPTARQFNMGKGNWLGNEFDLTLTYDYTEDVQFSLLGGVLLTSKSTVNADTFDLNGNAHAQKNAAAVELIGTMKVTF